MSPEQARGDWINVGPPSDIYGLGATLYVLLTGQPPYAGETPWDIVSKVSAGPCTPPEQVNRKIPRPLAAICKKAMNRSPQDRYSSAQEMAGDMERWLADEPVTVWSDSTFVRTKRWLRKHSRIATGLAVAVLFSIVGLGTFAIQERNAHRVLSEAHTRWRQASVAFLTASRADPTMDPNIQQAIAISGPPIRLNPRSPPYDIDSDGPRATVREGLAWRWSSNWSRRPRRTGGY
jgi:serine/threonine protein kinase